MKRLLVLGAIASAMLACAAPAATVAPSATVTPSEHTTRSKTTAASPPPATASPPLATSAIVDTSIATLWAAPSPPPEPPPTPPRGERDHLAISVPRARVPGRRAPCFAHRDVLVGDEIWRDLSQYAIGMSSDQPPSTRYGTCTIADGQLRDANGALLAELHCGISVYAPGIIDHLGFEVGARGTDVAAAHVAEYREAEAQYDPPRRLTADAMCWAEGDKHTRCWIDRGDGNEPGSHYVFAATTPMPERGPLKGAHARTFFASHTVARFTVRITCH